MKNRFLIGALCFVLGSFGFALDDFNGIDFVSFEGGEFIIGDSVQSFKTDRYVNSFEMNRYETTYKLWYDVRIWAESNGYVFENPGQEGSGGMRGRLPGEFSGNQPVTTISWYDAVVWCNAFSEMKGRTPCYTYEGIVLRDSTDTAVCDLCVCNFECNGYRLPSEAEWEYAARKSAAGFQRGNLASGQVNEYGRSDDNIPAGEVAWYYENASETHIVGTAGTPFVSSAPPSPASGNPNGSGLFDMSGNVLEFCWDWSSDYKDVEFGVPYYGEKYGETRVVRGGSWSIFTWFIYAADRYAFDPNEAYNYMGFRICSSLVE